jgi:sporulation protein YlmC with PRC-barrel domain
MPVSVKSFSELTRKDVFTHKGSYCGKILDVGLDLEKFRVKSLVVDAVRGSFLASLVGDKKGVIVPFSMVQSVGDVVIIKHVQPTAVETEAEEMPSN